MFTLKIQNCTFKVTNQHHLIANFNRLINFVLEKIVCMTDTTSHTFELRS